KAGNDAEGHLRSGALAVQDSLVHSQADGLGNHLHDPRGQVDVVVLQQRVANGNIASDLVAVQSHLVESEAEFANCAAHFGPNSFGNSASDGLASLATDITHTHAVQQLGIPEHVLRNQV